MRELLIATGNAGKVPEILAVLRGLPFTLITLKDVDAGPEVEEAGTTFEENAQLKARLYAERTGKLTLADDSGLEVDALHGRPGVFSGRYAATAKERNAKLLTELADVPDEKRTARFHSSIAIYDPTSGKRATCDGTVEGRIALEPRGEEGFGYDPIFIYATGKTGGEMSREEKNMYSHRGIALAKAREILMTEFV
jgi:XTP/dITP diphosphohydrolase